MKKLFSSFLHHLKPLPPFDYTLIVAGLAMSSLPLWSGPLPYPVACIAMGRAAVGAGFRSSSYGLVCVIVMFVSMLF